MNAEQKFVIAAQEESTIRLQQQTEQVSILINVLINENECKITLGALLILMWFIPKLSSALTFILVNTFKTSMKTAMLEKPYVLINVSLIVLLFNAVLNCFS